MRARQPDTDELHKGRDAICFFIVRGQSEDGDDIEAVLREAASGFGAVTHSLTFSAWLSLPRKRANDFAFFVQQGIPDARCFDAIDHAARSTHAIWVLPKLAISALDAQPLTRPRALLAREDMSASNVRVAVRALRSARREEQKLLGVIARQNQALSDIRSIRERLESTLRSGAFEREDAFATLREVEASLSRSLLGSPYVLASTSRSPDLVQIIGDLLPNWTRDDSGSVSTLVSDGPIWLRANAVDVERLLDNLVGNWRRDRQMGDRLELIVWDAGECARLAVVLTRMVAGRDRQTALNAFAARLSHSVEPIAEACGGSIERARETPGRATLTFVLPKRLAARAPAKRPISRAQFDLVEPFRD